MPVLASLTGGVATGGFCTRKEQNIWKFLKSKRCLASMPVDKENICFGKALCCGVAHVYNKGDQRYVHYSESKECGELARHLHRTAGVPMGQPLNDFQLQDLCRALPPNIVVHCLDTKLALNRRFPPQAGESLDFPEWEPSEKATNDIIILVHENHAYYVTNLPPLLNSSYACLKCLKGWSKPGDHRCEQSTCPDCQNVKCSEQHREGFRHIHSHQLTCERYGDKFLHNSLLMYASIVSWLFFQMQAKFQACMSHDP